jgi:DnaK suppressor protein
MDIEDFKRRLISREQDLTEQIAQLSSEARESSSAEVEDPIDVVTSSEGKAAALEETTILSATLRQVQDALKRIEDGTYGRCIECGREIEPARLRAVPWTPYCLADQEKHDRREAEILDSSLSSSL